jgi:hypothetical protein
MASRIVSVVRSVASTLLFPFGISSAIASPTLFFRAMRGARDPCVRAVPAGFRREMPALWDGGPPAPRRPGRSPPPAGIEFRCPACDHRFKRGEGGETGGMCEPCFDAVLRKAHRQQDAGGK